MNIKRPGCVVLISEILQKPKQLMSGFRTRLLPLFILLILFTSASKGDAIQYEQSAIPSDDRDDALVAAEITCAGFQEAKNMLRHAYEEHLTQREVAFHLESVMRSLGADGPLSFPTLVMSGSELVEPHGDATDDTEHEIDPDTEPVVMIDMGAKYNGLCSDVTRTFFFDSATTDMHEAYQAVLDAEMGVIQAIAPGVAVHDLNAIVQSALADYLEMEGVTGLTYWGHGVGRWVHMEPVLWSGSDAVLQEGDIIAIEPGLYFEEGWAVRIEDTVIVTDTGYDILSEFPRELDDVIIASTDPIIRADLEASSYVYGLDTDIILRILSSSSSVDNVDFFDGYSWREMEKENDTTYSISYFLDYSYSGRQMIIARINCSSSEWYFSEAITSNAIASEQNALEIAIEANGETEPPDSPLIWILSDSNASMIRVFFNVLDAPLYDQFLIIDSSGRVVVDYRGLHEKLFWSAWVAGDEVTIRIARTDSPLSGTVGDFRIRIDTVEVIYGEPTIPSTTTKPSLTSSTIESNSTTSSSRSSGRLYLGLQAGFAISAVLVLVSYQLLRKRR